MSGPSPRRYVCMTDLNNYFRKSDLLKGLTELERQQVRTNLGIMHYTGEGGQSVPVSITYANLYDLIQRNTLVVGARYIITDFQTIYSSNVLNVLNQKVTWGALINPSLIYNLVVIANTNSTLDSRAMILEHPEWVVEYDPTKQMLQDGVSTKGRITFLKDDNNNSAYYDFKNVKFRRTSAELLNTNLLITASYLDFYTFSDIVNTQVIDASNLETTRYNKMHEDCFNNVFLGDTYNNVIESGCVNNTFLRGCHDTTLKWNSVNNLFNENVCYTSGSIYNKIIPIGNTNFSTAITKTIHKVNEVTLISFLDPITYAYQIILL